MIVRSHAGIPYDNAGRIEARARHLVERGKKRERNQRILQLKGEGLSCAVIGREFGISRQRVYQIVSRRHAH
jgi:DNA-binding CsgD family transcriptional regulator